MAESKNSCQEQSKSSKNAVVSGIVSGIVGACVGWALSLFS